MSTAQEQPRGTQQLHSAPTLEKMTPQAHAFSAPASLEQYCVEPGPRTHGSQVEILPRPHGLPHVVWRGSG